MNTTEAIERLRSISHELIDISAQLHAANSRPAYLPEVKEYCTLGGVTGRITSQVNVAPPLSPEELLEAELEAGPSLSGKPRSSSAPIPLPPPFEEPLQSAPSRPLSRLQQRQQAAARQHGAPIPSKPQAKPQPKPPAPETFLIDGKAIPDACDVDLHRTHGPTVAH